jgi:hypothetical protein
MFQDYLPLVVLWCFQFEVFLQSSIETWEVAVDPDHGRAQWVQYVSTDLVESSRKEGKGAVVLLDAQENVGEVHS